MVIRLIVEWELPTILLPADDIVPLEMSDSDIPVWSRLLVVDVGEEHADYTTIVGLYVGMVHVESQLK